MAELAPYAMDVRSSQGRRYPEPPHPYRNNYQRDRDRIVHSRAFRRLEAKTQVFTQRFSDHFRNRLTHSLEVAQISRTIASVLGLNLDLCEALALAHDIGHPPFGHAGEEKLNALMQAYGDSFDHNLHALRIVEDFEQRYADFPGLNLTFEVREGLIKHSREYDPTHFPELAEYWLERQPPLESQLVALADEIAYNTADLDDGYEAKLVELPAVLVFQETFVDVARRYPKAPEKLQFNETLMHVIDYLVSDLIENTQKQLTAEGIKTVDDVRACPRRLVAFSSAATEQSAQLKQFLYDHLYANPKLTAEREQAVRKLEELFQFYMAQPQRLPRAHFEKTREQALHRVVCDYIAGMTDTYVFRQHRELFSPNPSPLTPSLA